MSTKRSLHQMTKDELIAEVQHVREMLETCKDAVGDYRTENRELRAVIESTQRNMREAAEARMVAEAELGREVCRLLAPLENLAVALQSRCPGCGAMPRLYAWDPGFDGLRITLRCTACECHIVDGGIYISDALREIGSAWLQMLANHEAQDGDRTENDQ